MQYGISTYGNTLFGNDLMSSHFTEPQDTNVYTTGTIGDPPLAIQESAYTSYAYDDTFSYVPRTRTVQTRVFRTDGLSGSDGFNFQASQVTVLE